MRNARALLPDSNTVLRYLLEDNEEQSKAAVEVFESVRTGEKKAIVLEGVLIECVYVLVKFYQIPKGDVAENLKTFLMYKGIVNADKKELLDALQLFVSRNLDIVDCILAAKSRSGDLTALTFNKKLKKLTRDGS